MARKYYRRSVKTICAKPGCRAIAEGSPYCPQHKYTPPKRERDPFLDSAVWRKTSRAKLEETPWCEYCKERDGSVVPAIDVDHVKPRKTHPALALAWSNLKSACNKCHCQKTRAGL